MKVAYIGKIQLSDIDLSYLHEAQQMADITYILETNPRFAQGPAFNFKKIYPRSGLFKASDAYSEFDKLKDFIDLNKCYVLNTSGRFWAIKSFYSNFLLLLFLIRQRFDVIHLTWSPNVYEWCLYILRKRMLLTVHDPFPHTGLDTFIVRLRRWLAFRLVPRFIILNEAQRDDFINYYRLSEDRVIDSRLSCYTYLRTIAPNSRQMAEGNYILFFGKISPYKGLDYLLSAMGKIHERCPDCRLIVAGGGRCHFDISRYLELDYIDIRNRFIPDEELVALIRGASFVVCPYTDATQSGVIMSAFAFDKPVIATNVGGLPEMVKHDKYGLIVKEKDIDELKDAIIKLWQQRHLVERYAKNIRDDYTSNGGLSWRNIAHKLCVEYGRTNK